MIMPARKSSLTAGPRRIGVFLLFVDGTDREAVVTVEVVVLRIDIVLCEGYNATVDRNGVEGRGPIVTGFSVIRAGLAGHLACCRKENPVNCFDF